MLTEVTVLSGYSVREDKTIRVSYRTDIKRDGILIASSIKEEIIIPGQDVTDKEQEIQDICGVIWTPEVIAKYRED